MKNHQKNYRSYMLRVWREKGGEGQLWRATLEDVMTSEQHHFASLEALFEYLGGSQVSNMDERVFTDWKDDAVLEHQPNSGCN